MGTMELILYFVFVAAAIGGVALLLNRLGQGGEESYTEEEAKAHLLAAHPGVQPEETIKAARAVLLSLGDGRIAVVRPMGRHPLVRIFGRDDIQAMDAEPGGLRIRTADFADPSIRLGAEDGAVLRNWILAHLEPPQ